MPGRRTSLLAGLDEGRKGSTQADPTTPAACGGRSKAESTITAAPLPAGYTRLIEELRETAIVLERQGDSARETLARLIGSVTALAQAVPAVATIAAVAADLLDPEAPRSAPRRHYR